MNNFSKPIDTLIKHLSQLPGIGTKTAQRLAFHIINMPSENVSDLSKAIIDAKNQIQFCNICQNISDSNPCGICASKERTDSIICVVETPRDVMAMEKSKEFTGKYHVLHGTISPSNSITPDMLKIRELVERMASDDVEEVILATNPTIDGEATAMYIARLLKPFNIKITRIARGLPMGSDIEYADEITITKALENRVSIF
ncbi:recombination protein RecR [Peptoanaerobacter stomatis]|uniref:Recombination protein RecR n=1 Tax=Peptoanaerobacter stomatis TaxID=796937 RepID=J5UAS8_9FIRM|nr:recombination mediator RecR [Peptoanaerobacter stomatis]EJU21104.1 recombination protein RecR [Peptoanaerobacter stomatis]NWO26008.1 recombination protein RecR [Peptostreptococcaceae bacterium oral taxon 081]